MWSVRAHLEQMLKAAVAVCDGLWLCGFCIILSPLQVWQREETKFSAAAGGITCQIQFTTNLFAGSICCGFNRHSMRMRHQGNNNPAIWTNKSSEGFTGDLQRWN